MIIVNTDNIEGYEVEETLGLVRGNTVRSKNIGKDIVAVVRTIFGGEIKEYTQAMQEARDQAIERMKEEAEEMGAEAIINVRFTTSSVMTGSAELLVYGTAVKLSAAGLDD